LSVSDFALDSELFDYLQRICTSGTSVREDDIDIRGSDYIVFAIFIAGVEKKLGIVVRVCQSDLSIDS
jgi:translation initiation factor 1 (eIF-1/SUI1)